MNDAQQRGEPFRVREVPALLAIALGLAGCGTRAGPVPPSAPQRGPAASSDAAVLGAEDVRAIVQAPDREQADIEADVRRKPVELLTFLRLRPGMKVADIGAGFGYTTELLARAVGPEGVVYGQNPRFVLERFAEAEWSRRVAKPVMANVVRLDREFVDPFPPELGDLDLVVNVLFYHDFAWMGVDRARHDAAVLAALAPGGRYVIVDSSAAEGAGTSGSESLHRIEEDLVRQELHAAGFELVREADFLRNPNDSRDWNALPWRNGGRSELSDKFVLEFRKPLDAR